MKSAREKMDMIAAYADVGSYRGAAALYDKLVPRAFGSADVTTALGNPRSAEATNHLPAFQHCA